MKPPLDLRLVDSTSERVRQSHHDKIVELQGVPLVGARILSGVELIDSTLTPIAHGLGRAPIFVCPSSPRAVTSATPITGSGRIVEVRDGSQDRTKIIVLEAVGFGVTVGVDLAVA